MQTEDSSAAAAISELRELGASRKTWYMGRHAASHRTYWVYTPGSYQVGTAAPLIMVLHGCMQPFFSHPWAIAYDTHINQLAETYQFLVVYPHHFAPPDYNPMSCWDFFLPENQHRGGGEPASLAGIVQDMLKNTSRWTIDQKRIYVAGISSGGGEVANLGATYPDVFAAMAVHSGGEYGYSVPFLSEQARARDAAEPLSEAEVASGEVERIAAIGAGPDPIKQGEKAFQAMGPFARVVPTIVFHGTDDHVCDPINGDQVVQQWITTNHLASPEDFTAAFEHPNSTVNYPAGSHGERPYTVYTWQDDHGHDVVIYYKVDGMGHAWSGGTPGSIFTDPRGPDASKAIYDFFMAHRNERAEMHYHQLAGERAPAASQFEEIARETTTQVTPTSLTVVKASPGKLRKVLVTAVNGPNAITIFDNASAASGTIIGVVAANAPAGTIYDLQIPAAHGITIAGTASPGTITVSYSS